MHERIKEHDRDIRLSRTQTSAVSEHVDMTGYYPLWDEVKFIDRDPHCGGTQREILRKTPKNNNKAWIKFSETILSILGDCWKKIICSSLPARLMEEFPASNLTTCNLTYWEVS